MQKRLLRYGSFKYETIHADEAEDQKRIQDVVIGGLTNGLFDQVSALRGEKHREASRQGIGCTWLTLADGAVPAGSQLFFYNFFTSTKLLEELHSRVILARGTFRTNKIFHLK